MTNKVKPFYIRITDDMTPQMVQDAFDKCRKFGVKDTELCDSLDYSYWVYFGVCGRDGLYYSDYHDNFHGDAKEITIDQLDGWLGLESKVEWNGEGLPPVGVECWFNWLNNTPEVCTPTYFGNGVGCYVDKSGNEYTMALDTVNFSKIETPEQKAERERLESAYDLYGVMCNYDEFAMLTYPQFKESDYLSGWLNVVDKTNYRKQ